jgi:hypothetical protein
MHSVLQLASTQAHAHVMLLCVLRAGVQVLAPRNAAITVKSSLMGTGGAPCASAA